MVSALAVAHRARGRGHARTLLLVLLSAFRAKRLWHAEAAVHGPTAAAARVFESVGMTPRAAVRALGEEPCPSEIERLAARAREEGRLGIDTEFMPEGRYRPLLCLVQVCVGDEVVVLDPLEGDIGDPAPLAAVLADPAVEIVLHAGRQDVAILRRAWNTTFTNVFDTQIAAGLRRASPPRPATPACCTTCSRSGSRSPPRSRAGTPARSPPSSSATPARTSSTCSRSPTSCSAGWPSAGGWSGRARSAS